MRYKLNYCGTTNESLLFWISKYIHHKLTTLSNRQVKKSEELLKIIASLRAQNNNIENLKKLAKTARNAGLIGINTYANPLFKLYDYLSSLNLQKLEDIDEETLIDFITFATSGLSNASRKNYRIALINFFGFIDKQNSENDKSHIFGFTLNISATRFKAKLPAYLNEDEIQRFLKAIDEYPFSAKVALRNKLMVKIIIYTGIRITELLNLKIKDIFEEKEVYMIQIMGKGGKERVVMISKKTIEKELKIYLASRDFYSPLLFTNIKQTALTQAYVHKTIENVLKYAGINKTKVGPHMLRHSFATLLYNKKHDLVLVQEALGHADLNTSKIYTHFDTNRLKEVVNIIDNLKED